MGSILKVLVGLGVAYLSYELGKKVKENEIEDTVILLKQSLLSKNEKYQLLIDYLEGRISDETIC